MCTPARSLVGLSLVAVLAACELDFSGVGDAIAAGFCGGSPCVLPPELPTLSASGAVRIGDYYAWPREATVLIFSEADTAAPIDSVIVTVFGSLKSYSVDFGSSPAPAVCAYRARAVLWSGERTELELLFRASPVACEPSGSAYTAGADFFFPAYAPLADPFTVTGSVRIDGAPATAGEATARIFVRLHEGGTQPHSLSTDDQGRYRFETNDRARWFAFCQGVEVQVDVPRPEGIVTYEAELRSAPLASCTGARNVPDVRSGTRKAAFGRVSVRGPAQDAPRLVGAGEARVALMRPADSTIVGEEFLTLDDGYFHVWFPHGLADPGCDWLLRAELPSGAREIRPLLPSWRPTCGEDVFHEFVLDTTAAP